MNTSNHNNHNFKVENPNGIIITNSWTTTSNGIMEFYYNAFELTLDIMNKYSNDIEIKLLVAENPNEKLKTLNQINSLVNQTTDTSPIIDSLKDIYQEEFFNKVANNIIIGKPTEIETDTIIFTDGCLPTKGNFIVNKVIVYLTNNDHWWAKNIKYFKAKNPKDVLMVELWYKDDGHFPITGIIANMQKQNPNIQINLKPNILFKPKQNLYKYYLNAKNQNKLESNKETFLVNVSSTHTEFYSKDLYKIDRTYECDSLKELKDIISLSKKDKKKLIMLGWNPNYTMDETIYFNKHPDQKVQEDRRLASIFAEDIQIYLGCETEVYPECDLPYENLLSEFDTYIHTPSLRNWEYQNRLIYDCFVFGKKIIFTKTAGTLLPINEGLKNLMMRLYSPKK